MVSGFITALQSAVLAIENELGTAAARNYVLKSGAVTITGLKTFQDYMCAPETSWEQQVTRRNLEAVREQSTRSQSVDFLEHPHEVACPQRPTFWYSIDHPAVGYSRSH
jgi:hypothetical protein